MQLIHLSGRLTKVIRNHLNQASFDTKKQTICVTLQIPFKLDF